MESYIRLSYSTRQGKFDLLSDDESYSCHIAILDENGNKLLSTNISPEYEMDGNDIEEAICELEEAIRRTWTTSDTRPEVLQFLKDNQEALEYGNDVYELAEVLKETERLASRAAVLSERIATPHPSNTKQEVEDE